MLKIVFLNSNMGASNILLGLKWQWAYLSQNEYWDAHFNRYGLILLQINCNNSVIRDIIKIMVFSKRSR